MKAWINCAKTCFNSASLCSDSMVENSGNNKLYVNVASL